MSAVARPIGGGSPEIGASDKGREGELARRSLATLRMPDEVRRVLVAFRAGLDHRFGARVRVVRLFGSRARGEAREDSDVDVLVVLDEVTREDFVAITDLVGDLFAEHGAMIDPRIRSEAMFERHRRQQRLLVREIERDGIEL